MLQLLLCSFYFLVCNLAKQYRSLMEHFLMTLLIHAFVDFKWTSYFTCFWFNGWPLYRAVLRPGNPGMHLIFAMTISRPGKYLKMKESPGKIKQLDKNSFICRKLPTLMLFVQFSKAFPSFFLRYSNCYIHTVQLKFLLPLLVCIYGHNICPGKNIKFVLKNSWISPGKIFNLFVYELTLL